MIGEYERLAAQQKLTAEESSCLAEEKNRLDGYRRKLRSKLLEAVQAGSGLFQGVRHDATGLGKSFVEVFSKLFDLVVPILYPRLEIGVLPLKGDEPEKLLTSANLNGLPPVFHDDKPERSLVIKQSGKFVPNLGADLCREILDYLKKEHAYGNKVTGKLLETHFSGIGYGWERDAIRLGLSCLFRGGAVEVTHQGRKYRNYSDPACRQPFVSNPAFRAASFAPRATLDLRILANAARAYEEITGKDVNIEEGDIAQAFRQVAAGDREKLLPLSARLLALKVPGAGEVSAHLEWIEGILEMAPDDCVKTLAGEGKSYLEGRKKVAAIESLASDANLRTLDTARRVLNEQWPILANRTPGPDLQRTAEALSAALAADNALEQLDRIRQTAEAIAAEYARLYRSTFEKRAKTYETALDHVKGLPEWDAVCKDVDVTDIERESLVQPLTAKLASELELPPCATVCRNTGATVSQMESDIAAVEPLTREVVRRLQQFLEPDENVERFRVADHFSGKISNEQELDEAWKPLREKLVKILAQGSKVVLE
jgi:hypothetical protein